MSKKVYVHIGHNKTGSSFIQSALASSVDLLTTYNIAYRDFVGDFPIAAKGKISSGNVQPELDLKNLVDEMLVEHSCFEKFLFSNEKLLRRLVANSTDLKQLVKEGFSIEILLFIRDPLEGAVATYGQLVKRNGFTGKISDYLKDYKDPQLVYEFLKKAEESDFNVSIYNYSRHRERILNIVEKWLGLPNQSLTRPPALVVNRSLTRSEAALQKEFNRHFGSKSSLFISDVLCNELPKVKSDPPKIPQGDLEAFLERIKIYTDLVNEILPRSEHYDIRNDTNIIEKYLERDEPEELIFSHAQIEVCVKAISEFVRSNCKQENNTRLPRILGFNSMKKLLKQTIRKMKHLTG